MGRTTKANEKVYDALMTAGWGLFMARRRKNDARKAHLASAAAAVRQLRDMGVFVARADIYMAETAAKAEFYSER
jgi:hypothetical protein